MKKHVIEWLRFIPFFLILLQLPGWSESKRDMPNAENATTIEALQALPKENIIHGTPVTVQGLLTYFEPGHRMAFLQDATGAIYLHAPIASEAKAGDMVEVKGILDPGYGGRNIRGADFDTSPEIRKIHSATYPEAVRFSDLSQAPSATGAVWTKIQAKVSSLSTVGDRYLISLENFPDLPVYMPITSRYDTPPSHLSGFQVEMSGVFADTPIQENPLRMKRIFLVPDIAHIHILNQQKIARFSAPPRGLSTLQWIPEKDGPDTLVCIEGIVSWRQQKKGFFLQAEKDAVWVDCAEREQPRVGQLVRSVGKPISYHGSGILSSAMWLPIDAANSRIKAERISPENTESPVHHGRLCEISATLVEKHPSPSELLWIMKTSKNLIFVHIPKNPAAQTMDFSPDSELLITGVVVNQSTPLLDVSYTNDVVHIFLRDQNDIQLLRKPSFWNMRRLTILLSSLVVLGTLAVIGLALLRAKVNKQAAIIKSNLSNDIIQSERLRLARQWHDTFEQHFAGLTMQFDAAACLVPEGSNLRHMLENAAQISNHSRNVARDAIWNLRISHDVTGLSFITQLQHELRKIWPDEYDRMLTVEYQETDIVLTEGVSLTLIRIAQEAVTNAFKHAHAKNIRVSWKSEGETGILSITDDGIGMNLENLASFASKGHFGILGIKERVALIGGTFEAFSPAPGAISGTMISVHVNFSASISN